jgi:hypothetical protein
MKDEGCAAEAWFSDWVAGVKVWDLMFDPDPSRAKAGINPLTRQPMIPMCR